MIRAIAVATDTSDLVGTVELACEPGGLALAFVRASAYAAAFAPTPPSAGRRIVVPWAHVREAWDDGETLRIALDSPRVPHRRLVLAHLTRDLEMTHGRIHRGRRETELLVAGTAAVVVAGGWAVLASIGGAIAILSGAALTFAAVALAIGAAQTLGRSAMLGGPDQAAVRRAFFEEVRCYLPKTAVRADDALLGTAIAAPAPPPEHGRTGRLAELAPALIAAGATAVIALLSLVIGGRMSAVDESAGRREVVPAAAAIAPPAAVTSSPVAVVPLEALETCSCQVPSSPVIPVRVPRVSVLSTVLRARPDPKHPSLSLEVAAVNNGADALKEVVGAVTFLAPGPHPSDPLRVRGDKGIYYEGPLASGAAVKWHVGGRGTAYRASVSDEVILDEDKLASGDAFAKLLDAHTRSVRVHGAAMLARARDERAAAAIEKLREDARMDEAPVLAALARAIAPVFVCEIEVRAAGAGASVSACVMNTSDEATGTLTTVLSASRRGASGEDATVPLAELALGAPFRLPAHGGSRVRGTAAIPARDVDVEIRVDEQAR